MIDLARPLRIAVVAPIMVRYDAISLAARDTVKTFSSDPRFEVRHFGCACDFLDVTHQPCSSTAELLLDPYYQAADVAIYHFGIYHNLFDALLAGGPKIRVVRFHNVTPIRFVSAEDRPVVERSMQQIELLRRAHEIWADSPSNANELLERGFDQAQVRVIPLAVDDPPFANLSDKQDDKVRILFVGRFVPSKGIHDLIAAIASFKLPHENLEVTLAGNTNWSTPEYLTRIRRLIAEHDLQDIVHLAGLVSDLDRERLLHAAHVLAMPSYHEGFCRPVAEGLRAGCIPVVYDGYNLPHVAAGLGRVVPTGNIDQLANALADLCRAIPISLSDPDKSNLPIDRGPTSANDFSLLANEHITSFSFESVAIAMRRRVLRLASELAVRVRP